MHLVTSSFLVTISSASDTSIVYVLPTFMLQHVASQQFLDLSPGIRQPERKTNMALLEANDSPEFLGLARGQEDRPQHPKRQSAGRPHQVHCFKDFR